MSQVPSLVNRNGAPNPSENFLPAGGLALGGTTYSWLHQASLYEALEGLAEAGFQQIELTSAAPHLQSQVFGAYERHELLRRLASLELELTSVNPGFLDINLLSPSNEFRAASLKVLLAEVELAADLGAPFVVIIPGRRHALAPAPEEACRWWFDKALEILIERAEKLGVGIALETSPNSFLGTAIDLMAIADRFDNPHLGITYDVANTMATGNVTEDLQAVASRLMIAHVSDSWRDNWAHTSPGRGEVDFTGYAKALTLIGYEGVTIYELVDMEPPMPRLHADIRALEAAGWTTARKGVLKRRPYARVLK